MLESTGSWFCLPLETYGILLSSIAANNWSNTWSCNGAWARILEGTSIETSTTAFFRCHTLKKILFIPGSYDEEKDKALESIRFWRGSIIKSFFEVYCHDPRRIEEYAQIIGDYTLENMALVISNTEEGIKKLPKVCLTWIYGDCGSQFKSRS